VLAVDAQGKSRWLVAEVAASPGRWLQVAELDVGFVAFALTGLVYVGLAEAKPTAKLAVSGAVASAISLQEIITYLLRHFV
jgi:hypothetical protein